MRAVPFRDRDSIRTSIRVLVTLIVLGSTLIASASPASSAGSRVDYRPPTDAPIVDRFRPPPKTWMAGNRGVDFGTESGAPIMAAADGRVIFAGQVGGELHVTIEHDDGLRTSSSFLAAISVSAGDRVRAGDVVGIAGGRVHFGVRTPDGDYLDPEALLAGTLRPRVRLVPGTDQGLDRLGAQERRSLLEVVIDRGSEAMVAAGAWSVTTSRLAAHYAIELAPATHSLRMARAFETWRDARSTCTSSAVPPPPMSSRRIAVVVSGLGTSSESNSAWEIDTRSVGYADPDVVRYSYSGGQAPRDPSVRGGGAQAVVARPLDAIPSRSFDSLDSQQSIGVSADRLAALLQSVATAQPGVPIDVLAHSQGGVVARLAIERAGAEGRLPEEVNTLVTIASPQQGAPLATGVVALGDSPGGAAALAQLRVSGLVDELDHHRPAIGELSEVSPVMAELHDRAMPERVRFVTIGGSGDLVVPGTSALDGGADGTVILPTAVGKEAHGALPSSPAVTRELALAVAGRGPTCQSLGTAMSMFLQSETIRFGQASAAAATAVGAGVLPVPPVR